MYSEVLIFVFVFLYICNIFISGFIVNTSNLTNLIKKITYL